MPGRDGTGPMGAGSKTGKGFGFCAVNDPIEKNAGTGRESGFGHGCGKRRGFGRGFSVNQNASISQKELLQEKRALLKRKLEAIDKQLESL